MYAEQFGWDKVICIKTKPSAPDPDESARKSQACMQRVRFKNRSRQRQLALIFVGMEECAN
jgi:hypothetical protein